MIQVTSHATLPYNHKPRGRVGRVSSFLVLITFNHSLAVGYFPKGDPMFISSHVLLLKDPGEMG